MIPESASLCALMPNTSALESLVIVSFVLCLSVRDLEATMSQALGSQPAASKSAPRCW